MSEDFLPDRLLRLPTVLAHIGVSRATLYRWIVDGTFVKPYRLSERMVAWRASEVMAWIEDRRKIS